MKKGIFITLEGGDGAGKSTLMQNLYQHLETEGRSVIQTRAPGGTALGAKIRSLLLHESLKMEGLSELFLFLADRAQLADEVIRPALDEGKIVLCDRFDDSTVAYQGVARDLDPDFVRGLCSLATKGLEPDLTFYLDIDPEIGLERTYHKSGVKDRMESETLYFHQKIRKAFQDIAVKNPERVHCLDATLSPEILFTKAYNAFNEFSNACR